MKNKRSSCSELKCPSLYEACLWRGDGDRPAHLIIVNSFPSAFSVGQGRPFTGHQGRLFKNILDFIRKFKDGMFADVQVYYTYAVLSALPAGAHDPPKKMLDACKSNLIKDILSVRGAGDHLPVIIPLGPVAARAIGLKFKNIYDITGRVLSLPLNTPQGVRQYKVVPLMSMKDMQANPGKINVEVASLLKATRLAIEGEVDTKENLDDLTRAYVYPKTIEEVKELVNHIIGYYDKTSKIGPDNWLVSFDTETNTLYPHKPGAKVLMLSVAWDKGKAATILLDHDECPYDKEAAWEHVRRLLASPKPKVPHNAKFDWKFLTKVHGVDIHRLAWDTLNGEHYLDEDKKGLYSLKKLTNIYTPAYEGYDEELQKALRASDLLDEDGRDAKGNTYITDEEIEQRVEAGAVPNWMEEGSEEADAWVELGKSLKSYNALRGKDIPGWVNPALSQRMAALHKEKADAKANKEPVADINTQISMLKKALKDDVKIVKSETRERIRNLKKRLKIKKPTKKTPQRGGKRGDGFEMIPLEQILQYAAVDSDITRMIAKEQIRRINAVGLGMDGMNVMSELYLKATPVLGDMEFHGVKVNLEYLSEIESDIFDLAQKSMKEIHHKIDPTLKLNSPAQIASLMQKMNFPAIPGIEAGSTNKEALEKYQRTFEEDDPRRVLVDNLLQYRSADKALGGFLKRIRWLSRMTGRIHTRYLLNGTSTGRLASSPNMQNIPKIMCRITKPVKSSDGTIKDVVIHPGYNIKKVFVPSKPGYKIVNMDIKGAELRVYPVYSNDQKMIDALLNDEDVHSITCAQIYGIPYEEVVRRKEAEDPDIIEKRTRAKRVIFGTFYGAGPWKISQQINSTVEEAEKIQKGLFNAFPALEAYVNNVKNEVRQRQFVKTVFGRCRRFRLAHLGGSYYSSACREAVNFLIQSTASDILLSQMCEMAEPVKSELGGQLLITVHDSVVLELPEENVDKLKAFFDYYVTQRVAEKFEWLQVPFLYDYEVGDNYGEVYAGDQEDD